MKTITVTLSPYESWAIMRALAGMYEDKLPLSWAQKRILSLLESDIDEQMCDDEEPNGTEDNLTEAERASV